MAAYAVTRMALGAVLLGSAALLGGCAAMSEQECRTANWGEQGMRDALDGYPRSRLQDIREACAEAGVRPNEQLYLNGWEAGIVRFCTPQNGARWGRDGKSYSNSCPPQMEAGFLDRYWVGRRAYDAEQNLRHLQSEQFSRQRDLDKAKDDDQRRRISSDRRDRDRRIANARDDLDRAEWQLRQGR